jgi:phospholipase A1/A2
MAKSSNLFGVGLLFVAIQSVPSCVLAQADSPSIAECAAMDGDVERLACYDRVSGRTGTTPAAPDQPPISVPVSKTPVTGSLIDTAWGFEPGSDRYMLNLYNPNYFLLARYNQQGEHRAFLTRLSGRRTGGEPQSYGG